MSSFNSTESELNNRINSLKELNKSLDDYKDLFSNLTKQKESDFEKLNEILNPKERATLDWSLGYSIYTNYYRILLMIINLFSRRLIFCFTKLMKNNL
jgi:hypothetical protein